MKYCHNCKTYRPQDATFCTRCGSSFDVKYCRKLHLNPVTAEYCSACGSSDLSMPHSRPTRGIVAPVVLLVVIISVVGTVLTVVFSPLIKDDAVAPWIVGGTALIGSAVVAWTFVKERG